MISFERMLKTYVDSYIGDCFFSLPAQVVGVQNISQNRIDVIPLPNKNHDDNTSQEYPVIRNVLLATQGTKDCAFLFPVKQGDVVLLTFSQAAIEQLKLGVTSPYDNFNRRFLDINDAIAYAGVTPFTESNRDGLRHTYQHSTDDLVVVNNIGSSNQNEIRLLPNGEIKITTSNKTVFDSSVEVNKNTTVNAELKAESVNVVSGASGVFTSLDGRVVVVTNGIITSIT